MYYTDLLNGKRQWIQYVWVIKTLVRVDLREW